jgi:hypothetical protein
MVGSWSQDVLIPDASNAYGLSDSPALAVYKGKLYYAHGGRGDSGWLWCATLDGTSWSPDSQVAPGGNPVGLSGSPALAVYKDRLYCVHGGRSDSGWLWVTSFDGTSWSPDTQVAPGGNPVGLSDSPALAVYQDRLYCVHGGRNDSGWLWVTSFDGTSWSPDTQVVASGNPVGLSASPALAVYDGLIYCVHGGRGDSGWTWCTTFDGTNWSEDHLIPDASNAYGLSDSPALAVFDNRLFCVRGGRGDSGWLWCGTFDGTNWSADARVTPGGNPVGLSNSPAVAEFGGRLYCLHGGRGDSGWTWCTSLPFGSTAGEISLLDVWGEGRIVMPDGFTTGFVQARNLNKIGQMVSNGASRFAEIPNLVPVTDYDNPVFPIADGTVDYVTLMGAPIVPGVATEMYRVLNKTNGVVLLYNPSDPDRRNFEANMGRLVYKPDDPLNPPFDQPTPRPVYIYGFPGVVDHDEL